MNDGLVDQMSDHVRSIPPTVSFSIDIGSGYKDSADDQSAAAGAGSEAAIAPRQRKGWGPRPGPGELKLASGVVASAGPGGGVRRLLHPPLDAVPVELFSKNDGGGGGGSGGGVGGGAVAGGGPRAAVAERPRVETKRAQDTAMQARISTNLTNKRNVVPPVAHNSSPRLRIKQGVKEDSDSELRNFGGSDEGSVDEEASNARQQEQERAVMARLSEQKRRQDEAREKANEVWSIAS